MSTSSIRSFSTSQQATTQSSPSHLSMKETPSSVSHSYYPSARRMVANVNNEIIGGCLKKPRIELTVTHDQWMETSVVMNTGQQPQPQQQSQQPPSPPQQQQKLPSVRCTVCKDSDGTPVLYRPSMALHTLFQAPDQDDPSPATARYSKRVTVPHDGTVLHKVDSNQQNINRLSYLSMYDITDGGGGANDGNDNSSRIGNDDKNEGNIDDNNNDSNNDDANGDDDDDDDDGGLYQRLVIPKQRQSYVTLYDATNDHPIWSLIEQDWHTMTLISRQPPQKYTLMTTSTFSFVWEDQAINGQQQSTNSSFLFPYQWQMKLAPDGAAIELLCEQCQPDRTRLPVALLANQATQLTIFGNDDDLTPTTTNATDENGNNITTPTTTATTTTTPLDDDGSSKNPFRSLQDNSNLHRQRKLDSLDTFLVLSSLLLYDLITSQLRALGGGMDAMAMMIDRQQQALKEEVDMVYKKYQQQQQQQHISALNDGALNGISHTNPSHYYSDHCLMAGQREENMDDINSEVVMDHHNDINNNGHQLRWSSNGSMKSLELDPGFWRCCFGYGCWWSWFPCCMPGGWCDRAWIKTRGIRRQQPHHHHHRSRVTRRMQGWQQQEE